MNFEGDYKHSVIQNRFILTHTQNEHTNLAVWSQCCFTSLTFHFKIFSRGKANKKLITLSPLKTQKKKKMKIIRAIKQPESVPLHFLIQISAYICCTVGTKRHITFQNRLVFTVHSYLSKLFFHILTQP